MSSVEFIKYTVAEINNDKSPDGFNCLWKHIFTLRDGDQQTVVVVIMSSRTILTTYEVSATINTIMAKLDIVRSDPTRGLVRKFIEKHCGNIERAVFKPAQVLFEEETDQDHLWKNVLYHINSGHMFCIHKNGLEGLSTFEDKVIHRRVLTRDVCRVGLNGSLTAIIYSNAKLAALERVIRDPTLDVDVFILNTDTGSWGIVDDD